MNIAKIILGGEYHTNNDIKSVLNPYTKKEVSQYYECDEDITNRAFEIAKSGAKKIKDSDLSKRVLWLEDVASRLKDNLEEFALIITDETGKPISHSKIEVQRTIETIRVSCAEAITISGELINSDAMPSGRKSISFYKRVPSGVISCITPFNFPLNLVAHKIAPALVSANAIVLKPTPEAPYIAFRFLELFVQSKYAIPEAINLLYGDKIVGNAMVVNKIPRVISFTGSLEVGKLITKNAGIKKVSLELGGNGATYINKSADIKFAASRCSYGAFYNAGQVCISLQRIYCDEDIYDEFIKELIKETSKLKVGNPYNEDTFVSSLINDESISRVKSWVDKAVDNGAVVACGNRVKDSVFYPTILSDVKSDMSVVCQEVFAPIVSVIKVKDSKEAFASINNTPFGLQYSIFTNSIKLANRAIDEFECGGVVINHIPTLRFDIQPYGGIGDSGIGKEGPKYSILEFTEIKSVVICS